MIQLVLASRSSHEQTRINGSRWSVPSDLTRQILLLKCTSWSTGVWIPTDRPAGKKVNRNNRPAVGALFIVKRRNKQFRQNNGWNLGGSAKPAQLLQSLRSVVLTEKFDTFDAWKGGCITSNYVRWQLHWKTHLCNKPKISIIEQIRLDNRKWAFLHVTWKLYEIWM